MMASREGRHNTIEGQVDRPLEDIANPGPDEDAEGEDEPIDGEDAEGEQDQLIGGEEGADHEPSGGKGVEQGAIVSFYF
jgi:hypothetical protein